MAAKKISIYDYLSPESLIHTLSAAYGGMSQFSELDIIRAAATRVYNNVWTGVDPNRGYEMFAKLCTDALEIFKDYWEDVDAQRSPEEKKDLVEHCNEAVDEWGNIFWDRRLPTSR